MEVPEGVEVGRAGQHQEYSAIYCLEAVRKGRQNLIEKCLHRSNYLTGQSRPRAKDTVELSSA